MKSILEWDSYSEQRLTIDDYISSIDNSILECNEMLKKSNLLSAWTRELFSISRYIMVRNDKPVIKNLKNESSIVIDVWLGRKKDRLKEIALKVSFNDQDTGEKVLTLTTVFTFDNSIWAWSQQGFYLELKKEIGKNVMLLLSNIAFTPNKNDNPRASKITVTGGSLKVYLDARGKGGINNIFPYHIFAFSISSDEYLKYLTENISFFMEPRNYIWNKQLPQYQELFNKINSRIKEIK